MSLFDPLERGGLRGDPSNGVAPIVCIRLSGPVVGKGRPRGRIVKPRFGQQFISFYTPSLTRTYESRLRDAALRAMAGRPPLEGPLAVTVWAFMGIPPSWSRSKRQAAFDGIIRPTGKPDDDNIGKIARDALNTTKKLGPGVWLDDAQIVDGRTIKVFAKRAQGIVIEVRRAGPPPQPYAA